MDSFFASVEQRDHPELRGKAIAVGHNGPRSVLSTASYEARKYGVHSSMPVSIALRKCPQLIIVPHHFEVYREISATMNRIFHEYTDLVEPMSLDEAYLDVTQPKKGPLSATLIANEIRAEIFRQTQLTASAGISYNKFLAKMASDVNKPDGYFVITPDHAETFLENLDIGRFYGVGKMTEKRMHAMGIHNGRDLKRVSREELSRVFGKPGRYFYDVVRGIDERPVHSSRKRKSIGAERTYEENLTTVDEVKTKLVDVIAIMWERCQAKEMIGKTVTLKVRFGDFRTVTRSTTQEHLFTKEEVVRFAFNLLPYEEIAADGVRLLGITMSNFSGENDDEDARDKKYPIQLEIDFHWDEIDAAAEEEKQWLLREKKNNN